MHIALCIYYVKSDKNTSFNEKKMRTLYLLPNRLTDVCYILGGINLVISGSNFGSSPLSADSVTIGAKPAQVIAYNDTHVTVTTPPQAPGSYPMNILTATGNADRT